MTNPLAQDLGGVVLLPCPFCGREATVENPDQGCYSIGCDDCCFSMMAGNVGIGWYATRAEAITAWNTRTNSDEIAVALRDAERYRWLRNKANFGRRTDPQVCMVDCLTGDFTMLHAEQADTAIDSAMQQGGGGGEAAA